MDDRAVSKQLDHMVKFIFREADEKAQEIAAKGDEEFAIEKARIVQQEKAKITAEYDRKKKQVDLQRRIERSNALNFSRLNVLKAREAALSELLAFTHMKLAGWSTQNPAEYKQLLVDLIVEGVQKIDETDVIIIGRKEDLSLVQEAAQKAAALIASKPSIKVDTVRFLPPSNQGNGQAFCSGGIVLSGMSGKIMCTNTLDARLQQAYTGLTPEIRNRVYGARQSGKAASAASTHGADLLGF